MPYNNTDKLALILLYTYSQKNDGIISFSAGFINNLIKQLKQRHLPPSVILNTDDNLLKELQFFDEDRQKLSKLLVHKAALIKQITELSLLGINTVTVLDKAYPQRLKNKLGIITPPALFYCGDLDILNRKSIAVVGSRNTSPNDMNNAAQIGRLCASGCVSLISGGARGVDNIAQDSVIGFGGSAAVFVSDNLLKKSTISNLKRYISGGRLVLLSQTNPNAQFESYIALERNKMIHAAGDFSIAVRAEYKKGGTWAGSYDCLSNRRTPLFVCDMPYSGNIALIEKGAHHLEIAAISDYNLKLYDYLKAKVNNYSQVGFKISD